MLLSSLAEGLGNLPSESQVLKPRGLYLPQGAVSAAWKSMDEALFANAKPRRSRAQRAGLAYQRRVLARLAVVPGCGSFTPSPWYCFNDDSPRRHYCQPDFTFERDGAIVVGEIKYRWTSDAWWQLRKLYQPVVKTATRRRVQVVCVCTGFDPAVRIPEPARLMPLGELAPGDEFFVWCWS